jgi:hypothetical protein
MNGHPATEIWHGEGGLAIAAIGSAEEREKSRILCNRLE